MIRRFLRMFRRKVPREVAQAATVLLMLPTPADAWERSRRNMREARDAGDTRATDHWWAVRREIEDRTGYRHGADVATRYLENG